MRTWIRETFVQIRNHTAQMNRRQKAEYVLAYYWYHLLFLIAGAGLLVLLIRHLFFAPPTKALICVIVNEQADYERDEALLRDFSEQSGMDQERILVDSDYIFSYGEVKLEGVNESSYEKFFFRWGSHELDVVVMPESFYRYCKETEYDFADLRAYCTQEQRAQYAGILIEEDGRYEALYVEDTRLMPYLKQMKEERMVLAVIPESEHTEADRAFLEFVLGTGIQKPGEGERYEEAQY